MATKKLIVYVKHEEGDESRHLNTKFTVPKSWRPGPVEKLLAFAVDTYNGKHADTPLAKDGVHFELEGETLGLEDVVEQCIQPKAELLIVSGVQGASKGLGAIIAPLGHHAFGQPLEVVLFLDNFFNFR